MTDNTKAHPLSLRDVASWQLPELTRDSQGQLHKPEMLAGLPSLQRGAVWRPNQVELLWDSILRGFPIGSLVVTQLLEKQVTRSGTHAGTGENLPWSKDQYTHHLLDGQQRANAVALGFLDPFPENKPQPSKMDTLLWLDLEPQSPQPVRGFEHSTRSHLLRVTTLAHPWGFQISDDPTPQRLEHSKAREAQENFRKHGGGATSSRPLPREGWPIDANVPIPLAWALEAAREVYDQPDGKETGSQPERALWERVWGRCEQYLGFDEAKAASQEPAHAVPWALRAHHTLKHWYEDYGKGTPPAQANHLARALARAVRAQIVALQIAPEALTEPYRLPKASNPSTAQIPIANVEHLFQRLNGGGTDLSPDERAYSMIKAYWPGIEGTIQSIKPRPPETQVALLGARLGLDLAQGAGMPTQPTVSSLRQLATVQASPDAGDTHKAKAAQLMLERAQIQSVFGLSASTTAQAPIATAIRQWDDWFLYSDTQPWGLPPVLRSRMASQAPEVFLFLLRLAYHGGSPDESVRRKLLGLATALHWFGLERETAVRWLWNTPPAHWLDGSAFTTDMPHVLTRIRYHDKSPSPQNKATIAGILRPEELASYIDPASFTSAPIKGWNWWHSLVDQPARQAARAKNPNATTEELNAAVNAYWAEHGDFIGMLSRHGYQGSNALLLMYAQREQMQCFFPNYDPQDADFWAAHNVPWDFDHLLQQDAYSNKKVDNDFIKVCQQWGNTIANLHLLPFEQNRSRQDKPLATMDDTQHEAFLRRIYLWDDTNPSKPSCLDAFSMQSEDIRSIEPDTRQPDAEQRVTDFVTASRARLLRLYSDWFETLEIGSML